MAKKKLKPCEAARKIVDIVWNHLKRLPKEERKRRLDAAHRRIVNRLTDN